MRAAPLLFLALTAACNHSSSQRPDAASAQSVVVHVPGALRIARSLDSLTVEIDPASRADADVILDPEMVLGVESRVKVFAPGQAQNSGERHGFASGASFDVGASTWSLSQDGIPRADQRYVAEMTLVLFETDVRPGHDWDPHAGRFKALFTRTIRQAEE